MPTNLKVMDIDYWWTGLLIVLGYAENLADQNEQQRREKFEEELQSKLLPKENKCDNAPSPDHIYRKTQTAILHRKNKSLLTTGKWHR